MIDGVDVVAQWVRTSWTKRSRGGPEAARRNAAPLGFVLPALGCPVVHEVAMDESGDFQPSQSLRDGEPDPQTVQLREVDARLRVELMLAAFGLPRRRRRAPAVWLGQGEWLRWQVNYRFGGAYAWTYRLDTLNLAYGPTTTDVFTGVPPRCVDERTHLR